MENITSDNFPSFKVNHNLIISRLVLNSTLNWMTNGTNYTENSTVKWISKIGIGSKALCVKSFSNENVNNLWSYNKKLYLFCENEAILLHRIQIRLSFGFYLFFPIRNLICFRAKYFLSQVRIRYSIRLGYGLVLDDTTWNVEFKWTWTWLNLATCSSTQIEEQCQQSSC